MNLDLCIDSSGSRDNSDMYGWFDGSSGGSGERRDSYDESTQVCPYLCLDLIFFLITHRFNPSQGLIH